ncbi:hypothetical protein [Pluralibacter gergoviae]|uniref:hypothetical protein n=1 Tax=Pluralibacter gergoviae TaxID=61647 RepID=UPI0012D3B3B0|nr:hypothetical protein [Pluralibacter gergoviae]EKV0927974.1 hypothetical protein [Pluralibacter gergoviae]EKV6249777.1 hypothetical protein [Pluralibacter gergoviae]EKW9969413.1 hypothetical protein [Pluralibacter gergoviae]EKZ9513096.1 hypothetical protein [Pluralibacter gergoviae]ELC3015192.1 hypothetical protein [Pluralibacter gergoviae]
MMCLLRRMLGRKPGGVNNTPPPVIYCAVAEGFIRRPKRDGCGEGKDDDKRE